MIKMDNNYMDVLRKGSFFPSSSTATLCFAKKKTIGDIKRSRIKKDIMKYMRSHRGAYISDLSQNLHVEPKKVVVAIRELKDEGLLV